MLTVTIFFPEKAKIISAFKYASYEEAEPYIEIFCERKADKGWELTEKSGSNSKIGEIEFVAPNNDKLILKWIESDTSHD